jgi:hypothetical protein
MKNLFAILLMSVSLVFLGCDENSTDSDGDNFSLGLVGGIVWNYGVYNTNESGEPTGDELSEESITLGSEAEYEGKSAHSMNYNTLGEDGQLFTHISKDGEGIYLYLGEIDVNQFDGVEPDTDTKIPILIPGWIKIYDFNQDNWESFFVELDQVIVQDTVKGKLIISGSKVGTETVNYQEDDYTALLSNLSIEVEAMVASPTLSVNEKVKSNLKFSFVEGVGIYSIMQEENVLLGIENDIIQVMKSGSLLLEE